MIVQPYLFFEGCCEEAVNFYAKALGAEITMMLRVKDAPERPPEGAMPGLTDDKIMHASFRVGQTIVMASDGGCSQASEFKGFRLSITADTEADADRMFAALAEGGSVDMPLGRTFFSPRFGMLTDRFGVGWMIVMDGQ
ncbi:VOC family protein [Bosea sp. 117]|uniref:VOC family protein n=1 Tax=Bosea sp. 117 TaxID=1125973 RepID=UPI0004942103|nr:VOC family protein [Bosea sp. 117]